MGFEALLGNERLKENLRNSLKNQHISHFYLISGPEGAGKHTLARLLAAAALCERSDAPCGVCNSCRKVMEGIHPDVITVEDPEHKNVSVKLVRQAREDVFVRPNEGSHKIYIFPQELGLEGQNALLKILEEPPSYGIFLLLTDNPERLLPTVRSRCTELALKGLPPQVLKEALRREFPETSAEVLQAAIARSGGYLGQARALLEQGGDLPPQTEQFLRSFIAKDALELTRTLVPMEKWKRDQLLQVLESWSHFFQEALACRSGLQPLHPLTGELAAKRTSQDLLMSITQLQKAMEYAQSNVSVAAICGYLSWQLR